MATTTESKPKAGNKGILVVALVGVAFLAFLLLRPEGAPTPEPTASAPQPVLQADPLPVPTFSPPPSPPQAEPPKFALKPQIESVACTTCENENRGKEGCKEDMGCETLAGEDKRLCEELLTCMRSNPECWAVNPNKCYCGTTRGTDCAKKPNGPCAEEAIAAAKTESPLTAGLRFFKTEFPSGHATQQIVCSLSACKSQCRTP